MNPTMTYLPVREFSVIRICCRHQDCRAVTELQPNRVETVLKKTGGCCPVCGHPFTKPDVEGGADVVTQLAKVVLALNALTHQVGIELPIAAND